jgi:2,4-dienoyl-CoA reductase-like NADH-dependent reductase (Old Yellow Enzyme family)
LLFRYCASDLAENGVGLDETVPFARMLQNAGVNCIDVSAGGTPISPPYSMSPNAARPSGCFAMLGGEIKKNVSVPVIIAGKIATRDVAEKILLLRQSDYIAVCRQLLADPDWPRKLMSNEEHLVTSCKYTNIGCFRESIDKGLTIRCSKNPRVGFDHDYEPFAENPGKDEAA